MRGIAGEIQQAKKMREQMETVYTISSNRYSIRRLNIADSGGHSLPRVGKGVIMNQPGSCVPRMREHESAFMMDLRALHRLLPKTMVT
jgi:hypothetical protein